ncbi:cupin domain-containing protein [Erythrobacter sp.]|jgi:mannose-6-phosphate isomerase-like protein (cupin superfamily)|uniref:cupin domain-containing protein n=1 Tax=Erythrobacter sp. TaxID=1042 RepID=UPI002EA33E31|nr:cupin domain-containing protein [Erythrobacter sp.]
MVAKSRKRNIEEGDGLEQRVVRYADLVPCYNAFVDTRTPGSEAKENFTIIGPGVSENPDQFVHIAEPHGFNIGGARQPPGCVNSQHSHKTAEVFVVHTGTWRFDFGEHGDDAQVVLSEGDVVSIPTNVFRGFTNIGMEVGYLYAVLGKDDPGRVTWAPTVFELAKDHGLVLLENGMLVDTEKGEKVPAGAMVMPPPEEAELARMARITSEKAEQYVWRQKDEASRSLELIGSEGMYPWDHGFTLRREALREGEKLDRSAPRCPEVVFIQEGRVELNSDQGTLELRKGDTFSVPPTLSHDLKAFENAVIFVTTRGN